MKFAYLIPLWNLPGYSGLLLRSKNMSVLNDPSGGRVSVHVCLVCLCVAL